jgi:hypothetical protein
MANKYVGTGEMPKGGGRSPQPMPGKPGSMPFKEKPGFPSAGVPGKTGPERSAGVPKIKQHPKEVGL